MSRERDRIEAALSDAGLRWTVGAIEDGPDGEVILWTGPWGGWAVRTVAEALTSAKQVERLMELD